MGKLLKPKRGKASNLGNLPVEDGSLIFAYEDTAPSSTVFVEIGERRLGLASSYAALADNSLALGGSSLKNIVDKIDGQTGGGNAFVSAGSTNATLELTRANGATTRLTFNNVANASTANMANKLGTATIGGQYVPIYLNGGSPSAISAIQSTFVLPQLINGTNLNGLRTPGTYYAQGGNTNTNMPSGVDAFGLQVIQSAGGWFTQILYASNGIEKIYSRFYNSGTNAWSSWIEHNRLNTRDLSGYVTAPTSANPNKVWRTNSAGDPFWGTLNDSSISKLAATITLGSGDAATIDQNNGTYRQRINILDDSAANTDVFTFQQSENSGNSYKTLFAIKDSGLVAASTFQGYLDGNAKNSLALGGSSLKDINNKIDNQTGGGKAFVEINTATDDKILLTRSNGSTVQKVVNNVSNASTAEYAKNASSGTAYYLKNNPSSRSTTANLAINGLGGLRTFKATSTMTQGKPAWDSHILHFDWDNAGGYDAQLAVRNSSDIHLQMRGMTQGAWGNWRTILDDSNYTDYAAKKNAYNSASVSDATIKLGRSDSSTGTTLTVNNVANASTAKLALNSNALGGSSLKNINDRIDNAIAANDAMHYMGTLGTGGTITALPSTARIGDAYKVINDGTFNGIAAETGDLFIYSSAGWNLIPSGDDGNVFIGDTKSSKFPNKSNNIVIAVGDQKVSSAANITANAGTISALQGTFTQLKANAGTITTLNSGSITGPLHGNADTATRLLSRGKLNAPTDFPDLAGLWMNAVYSTQTTGFPATYGNTLTMYDGGAGQLFIGWNGNNPGTFVRHKRDTSEAWSPWNRFITSADALQTSATAIASTNNYFTAGATTAYIASKVTSAIGNYLPLTGGTLTGNILFANSGTALRGIQGTIADNDAWRVMGGGTASNAGYLEIATADDTNEPIYVRQYSGTFGTIKRTLTLLDSNGNTTMPGVATASSFQGMLYRAGQSVSWKEGNSGKGALINQTSYAGWQPIIRAKSSNGVWTTGLWSDNKFYINYTSDTTIAGTANSCDKQIILSPNGDITGFRNAISSTFTGYLNGTAKNADTLDSFHAINSSALTSTAVSGKIVIAKNITDYITAQNFATKGELTAAISWIEF